MLIVEPIQKKEDQEKLCKKCGIDYDADCLAYSAWVDGELVGVCQFGYREDGVVFLGALNSMPLSSVEDGNASCQKRLLCSRLFARSSDHAEDASAQEIKNLGGNLFIRHCAAFDPLRHFVFRACHVAAHAFDRYADEPLWLALHRQFFKRRPRRKRHMQPHAGSIHQLARVQIQTAAQQRQPAVFTEQNFRRSAGQMQGQKRFSAVDTRVHHRRAHMAFLMTDRIKGTRSKAAAARA